MDRLKKLAVTGIFAVLLMSRALSVTALAAPSEGIIDTRELEEKLPTEAAEVLKNASLSPSQGVLGGVSGGVSKVFGNVFSTLCRALGGVFRGALAGGVSVLAAAVLCSVAGSLTEAPNGVDHVNIVGVFVILASTVGSFGTLMGEAREVIGELSDIGTMLLPVMASASAASGAAASGAAKYAASALFLNVLGQLSKKLIVPLIYMFLAASAGEAAFGGGVGGAAKLMARLIKQALTVTALAFSVYLTAVSLVASSADAVTVKLTKTAISTLLPVVGGMVSEAADAVASGVGVIRSAAGAAGVVAVAAVCAVPFLKLAVNSLVLRAAAALSETVAPKAVTGFIESVATAYSLMLALAGTEAVMLTVSVIAAAKGLGA